MTDSTAERLILMMQLQIEAMGMQAANEERKIRDEAPAYNEGHFQELVSRFHREAP